MGRRTTGRQAANLESKAQHTQSHSSPLPLDKHTKRMNRQQELAWKNYRYGAKHYAERVIEGFRVGFVKYGEMPDPICTVTK